MQSTEINKTTARRVTLTTVTDDDDGPIPGIVVETASTDALGAPQWVLDYHTGDSHATEADLALVIDRAWPGALDRAAPTLLGVSGGSRVVVTRGNRQVWRDGTLTDCACAQLVLEHESRDAQGGVRWLADSSGRSHWLDRSGTARVVVTDLVLLLAAAVLGHSVTPGV